MLQLKDIDKTWSLFLDRDGVINRERKEDYVKHWHEFEFYEGAPEAIAKAGSLFGYVFIATNQRGVGKQVMSEADLHSIHRQMIAAIENKGGHIDRIYYNTALTNDDPLRKPNPGMAWKAKNDFPGVDLSKSIMVGNNMSDMEFGRNAGMHTVFVETTELNLRKPHPAVDLFFPSLSAFAKAL